MWWSVLGGLWVLWARLDPNYKRENFFFSFFLSFSLFVEDEGIFGKWYVKICYNIHQWSKISVEIWLSQMASSIYFLISFLGSKCVMESNDVKTLSNMMLSWYSGDDVVLIQNDIIFNTSKMMSFLDQHKWTVAMHCLFYYRLG